MVSKKNTSNKIFPLTGGLAAAEFLRQMDPEVMAVYPITPQTPIIEAFAKMKADGEVDTEIVTVESEHSAMSATIGASAAGVRAVTATSSQGLALMHEMLYIASGLRLPIFMFVSARALAAPLNIHGDHSDVMGSRDAGWIQIFSENAQEVYDNSLIGIRIAEKVGLPVMVVMDGFNTSHTTERVEVLPDEKVKKFIGTYKSEKYLLDVENPSTFGVLALQNSYFEFKIDQAEAYDRAKKEYKSVVKDFAGEFGRKYDLFEEYRVKDAERVIVIMGSVAGTAKDVVDELRKNGEKVGLLKIKLFRPFPHKEVAKALAHVKNIAVFDRAMSPGTLPPLYMEIVNASQVTGHQSQVTGYIYGLGGRETTKKQIRKVFEELGNNNDCVEIGYLK